MRRLKLTAPTFGALVFCCALAGCGGGGGDGSPPAAPAGSSSASADSPPSLSGSPSASASVGDAFAFTPVAADADGDDLVFSVANLPHWATFDDATGTVSGTPATKDIGTYSNIQISASDGLLAVSLAPFTVTVDAGGPGAATLSWLPPTEKTDGSALTDLAGYRIVYGTSRTALNRSLTISGVGVTRAVIPNLSTVKWYFGIRAFRKDGTESALSQLQSKTIS